MSTIAERIKTVRKDAAFTQQKFADTLGLKRNTVGGYEIGTVTPSDRTISDICREFDVNEVWLRTGEGDPDLRRTKEEEIMRFAVRTAKGSEGFKKQLAYMLSQLDEEDWSNLEQIYQKQLNKIKNSDR